MRAPKSRGRIAGPKDPTEALDKELVLFPCEYECKSGGGGEFVRVKPKEEVDALADEARLRRPELSVGVTEVLSALGEGANTREL